MRALFWFSRTATLFSKHLMYSFFLFLHSRAASLFFIRRISLFLTASSPRPLPPPELPLALPPPPPPPPPLVSPPLELEEAVRLPTVIICAPAAAAATVPGINTVWPFWEVAAYCTTPLPPPDAVALPEVDAAAALPNGLFDPDEARADGDTI